MSKRTTNWDSVESWQRLVSSIIATGVKVDLRATATFFGTTYDTLENRFRKLKKDSATLQAEVGGGERAEVTPTRTKSTPSTPRKPKTPKKEPLATVANGRVTKKTPNKKSPVKEEQKSSDASFSFEDVPANEETSFDDIFANGIRVGDEEYFV